MTNKLNFVYEFITTWLMEEPRRSVTLRMEPYAILITFQNIKPEGRRFIELAIGIKEVQHAISTNFFIEKLKSFSKEVE